MAHINALEKRSGSNCELCKAHGNLEIYKIEPNNNGRAEQAIFICDKCLSQIDSKKPDPHHWHCLSSAMWSEVPAVQVMAWRLLSRLENEAWAQDLLEQLYLDDETLTWAKAGLNEDKDHIDEIKHLDANGAILASGDSVTLIKDLNVKGAGFTAKRGTAVRNISLVLDNEKQIEGRINGQQIVILVEFVKKSA